MWTEYHRQITRETLTPFFTPDAVEVAIEANDAQDYLRGQIGHPEYHVDNSVVKGYAYMLAQREQALRHFRQQNCAEGMQALGRCLHTIQDFYSHSNYVHLWLADNGGPKSADSDDIPPLLDWRAHENLRTGRATFFEGLTYLPVIGKHLARALPMPADSHFMLNLDGPHRGPEFAFVMAAARKHSEWLVQDMQRCIVAEGLGAALPCLRRVRPPSTPVDSGDEV